MLGQGKLHENAVHLRVPREPFDQREKFSLARRRRKVELQGMESALLGRLALGADIGLACRIFADQHHRQTRLHTGR